MVIIQESLSEIVSSSRIKVEEFHEILRMIAINNR